MFNILLVDDSPLIRKMLRRIVNDSGVPVQTIFEAVNGAEALTVLEANKISMMLSDVNMPVMDGFELLANVRNRAEWNTMPVVMVTTEGGEDSVLSAVQKGANGYIVKPFVPADVRQKLIECLGVEAA